LFESAPDMPIRERLVQVGRVFFAFVSSPEALAGHRMLCSPRMADSPLPAKFWEAGPARVQRVFADLLRRRAERGELEIADPTLAARQFLALLKGELHTRMVLGCCGHCADPEGHVAATVDFFLRAYAPRGGGPMPSVPVPSRPRSRRAPAAILSGPPRPRPGKTGGPARGPRADPEGHVAPTVDFFLRAYAPRGGGPMTSVPVTSGTQSRRAAAAILSEPSRPRAGKIAGPAAWPPPARSS